MQLILLITQICFCLVAIVPMCTMANRTVHEVDGLLYVMEPINTFRMTRHIQLWAADLQGDVDKLHMLMASGTINDLSFLMVTVNQMASEGYERVNPQLSKRDKVDSDDEGNTLRHQKRNILVDVLHFVARVPTDKMMAKLSLSSLSLLRRHHACTALHRHRLLHKPPP
jgi:hypothetical protein